MCVIGGSCLERVVDQFRVLWRLIEVDHYICQVVVWYWDANCYVIGFVASGWVYFVQGFICFGGCRDYGYCCCFILLQFTYWNVDEGLIGGVGVNGCEGQIMYIEGFIQYMYNRCKIVRCIVGVGYDSVVGGEFFIVHVQNDCAIRFGSWCCDQYFLCIGIEMFLCY